MGGGGGVIYLEGIIFCFFMINYSHIANYYGDREKKKTAAILNLTFLVAVLQIIILRNEKERFNQSFDLSKGVRRKY